MAEHSPDLIFTVSITCISQVLRWRDQVSGRLKRVHSSDFDGSLASRHSVASDAFLLDAVFVEPQARSAVASLLICHGIGETVDCWRGVQHMLALEGVASLVFDYAGYGKSTGRVCAAQCERDAVASSLRLRELTRNLPLGLLGFSLGSGIACAVAEETSAHVLVLCAAFTSFRNAVRRLHLPAALAPDVWDNAEALRNGCIPVLLMHGERDLLFRPEMAYALERACAAPARVIVVPGLDHDGPCYRPHSPYWAQVAEACKGNI